MTPSDQVQKALEQGKKANVKKWVDAQIEKGNRDQVVNLLKKLDHPDAKDIL